MKKRSLNLPVVILLIISIFFIVGCIEEQNKNHVNDSTSIQEIINKATDGDILYIQSGAYYGNIIINKSISLIGEDQNTTVIYGESGEAVNITADNCIFQGFKITSQNINIKSIGIKINADYANINNNIIQSTSYGIVFNKQSNGNIVFENTIINNSYGLYLTESSFNNISSNHIYLNSNRGVYVSKSKNNTIISNIIEDDEYGITLFNSENNTISNNNLFSNKQYGIYIGSESSNNTVESNSILNNFYGIRIKSSIFNTITKNVLKDNDQGVYCCCGAEDNTIYKNIFINNSLWHAEGNNNNKWDYQGFGNYWANYTGIDEDGNGIADTSFIFNGVVDNYPLLDESIIYTT